MQNNLLNNILIFDGAMGTMLQQMGLKPGQSSEAMNIEAPEIVGKIHEAYLEAGADVITTNTCGGNRLKLEEYNLADQTKQINEAAMHIARSAADKKGKLVAASVGPTGHFVYPIGDLPFESAYDSFREQIKILKEAGANFIILETFSDMGEIRAACLAAKDIGNIPIIASMTYEKLRTLTGVSPASAAVVLESLGVAALGANCSGGPQELLPIAKEIMENTSLPVIIQPNAGLPSIKNGKTVFSLEANEFKTAMVPFFALGVNLIGSCCGSTPEFTKGLKELSIDFKYQGRPQIKRSTFASREQIVILDDNRPTALIGERINPSARKSIKESIQKGDYSLVQEEAIKQVEHGAHLIDINAGVYGLDQGVAMVEMINVLQKSISAPIVVDNTQAEVIEKALRAYHGKALVNSVSGEAKALSEILPIIKRYGAGVIGLALDEDGVPTSADKRFAIAQKIVESCLHYGIPKEDIYIDCLVMAVGAGINSATETLKALSMVKKELQVKTVLGVSNVSHGMPARKKINTAFLAMAIGAGLDLAIINPMDQGSMDIWQGACLLAGRDPAATNFIKHNTLTEEKPINKAIEEISTLESARQMIITGSLKIEDTINTLLNQGVSPQEIVDEALVSGLTYVGNQFEEDIIFLPQLMLSAEAAQKAFTILENHFGKSGGFVSKGTVVIGTVKGDVHDIGKNMVAVMLKNSGYKVIDLGKNVSPEDFILACQEEKADIVALSALMTTTMIEIPTTTKLIKDALPGIKVIAGGAVVSADFALEADTDGYSKDAAGAVKVVEDLLRRR